MTDRQPSLAIEMLPVQSSNIRAIGYDESTKTLAVQFANGIYHYAGIDPELFQSLTAADSKGKFFQQNIRPHFKGVKQEISPEPLNKLVDRVCEIVEGGAA